MQEQTYPRSRPATPLVGASPMGTSPVGAAEERRAREEWQKQLDQMLDDYRCRYVLRSDSYNGALSGSLFDGG